MKALEPIKRFVKGGYIRTADGDFGTIVDAAGDHVTFRTTCGKLRTIYKSGAFKASRQEVERRKAEAAAEYEAAAMRVAKAAAAAEAAAKVIAKAAAEAETEAEANVDTDTEERKESASIVPDSYRQRYQNVRSANGHSSKICGDRVSKMLHGKTLEQVAEIVAEYIEVSAAELLGRYEHLNPGQQRMNMGNRLRAWARENQPELLIKE